MRLWKILALVLTLCLLLQIGAFGVDSLQSGSESLTGKRFLVLGDSYTAGYGLEDVTLDWTYLMADNYGMTQMNYSVNGSSISAGALGYEPMVRRCQTLPADADPDFVLIQGGSNDYFLSIPVGTPESWDPGNVCGALNCILDTLQEKYPRAVLIGFTPWISDITENLAGNTQGAYTRAILDVFQSRGLFCYDASDTAENGMDLDDRAFRTEYALTPGDWYHLSAAGHRLFAPVFAEWLEETVFQVGLNDQFYDLAESGEQVRSAAAALTGAGIMEGVSEHLFAPTASASRADLALALYRMAGEPEIEGRDLYDVEGETYEAFAWAMEVEIFPEANYVSPGTALTREEVAQVLYLYYTEYLGYTLEKTVGLGSYPDGSAVAPSARLAMGWALDRWVLREQEGLLRPGALISRGELARSLQTLLDME